MLRPIQDATVRACKMPRRVAALLACLWCGFFAAGCATAPSRDAAQERDIEALARSWLRATPASPIIELRTVEQAMQAQPRFLQRTARRLGDPVGYKIALTSDAARRQIGAEAPIYGVLFEEMLLPSPARIPAASGARLMVEGDLILRIGSGIINNAATPEEAGPFIDAVIPFIEVPDLLYRSDVPFSAADLAVINAGARFGVLGAPLPISMREDGFQRLAGFRVELLDAHGDLVSRGQARDVMGHPLAAVLWLRDALHARGHRLRRGDLISVGSFTDLIPVTSGTTYTVRYIGLVPGEPVDVQVHFE